MIVGDPEDLGGRPSPRAGEERSTAELGAAFGDARAYVDLLLDELRERGKLALARARLRILERAFGAIVLVVLSLALVAASAAGSWMLVRGVRGGLARVLPGWLADLGTGALVLGAIAGALLLLRASMYRGVLKGLRPADAPSPAPTEEHAP